MMPPLKQPSSLESTVLQSIHNFILEIGQQLLGKVCSGVPPTMLPPRWGVPSYLQKPAKQEITKCTDIAELQSFLHPNLPVHLSDSVTVVVLEAITTLISTAKCTCDGFSKSGDDSCHEVIEKLISISLHAQISQLDLLQWPWCIGEILIKHLDKFHHLKVLRLWPGNWSPLWATVVKMLENDCCSLKNLVSFSMRCHCTDRVVNVISQSMILQYLDVMSSVEVTDKCVNSLLRLKNLKVVNMCSTSLTADGYTRLLLGLPNLRKLMWFDLNCQALGSIRTSPIGLHSYEASRVSVSQLNILVHMCMNLTHISLLWVEADLSILGALKHLKEIKLAHCSALNVNLRGLLELKGYNLISLELHEVIDVDLVMIGFHCLNLKRLNLVCDFQSVQEYFIGMDMLSFKQLEELRFGSQYSDHLFSNCVSIRKLEILKCHNFNDQVVATLLMKNPLKHLQALSIAHSGHLTLNTVRLLLEKCDNLRVLEGLDSWGGITKSQVNELCIEMRRKNFNIQILWKKPLNISW